MAFPPATPENRNPQEEPDDLDRQRLLDQQTALIDRTLAGIGELASALRQAPPPPSSAQATQQQAERAERRTESRREDREMTAREARIFAKQRVEEADPSQQTRMMRRRGMVSPERPGVIRYGKGEEMSAGEFRRLGKEDIEGLSDRDRKKLEAARTSLIDAMADEIQEASKETEGQRTSRQHKFEGAVDAGIVALAGMILGPHIGALVGNAVGYGGGAPGGGGAAGGGAGGGGGGGHMMRNVGMAAAARRFMGGGAGGGGGLGGFLPKFLVTHTALALAVPAIEQVASRALSFYREQTALGQTSGQGFREGVGETLRSRVYALNPFDMISNQVAMAVVHGLRQRGLSGQIGRALERPVIAAVNDLGVAMSDTIMDYANFMARNTTDTMEDAAKTAVQALRGIDTEARALHMTTEEAGRQLSDYSKFFAGQGAQSAESISRLGTTFLEYFGGTNIQPDTAGRLLQAISPSLVGTSFGRRGAPEPALLFADRYQAATVAKVGPAIRQLVTGGRQMSDQEIDDELRRISYAGAAAGPLGEAFAGDYQGLKTLWDQVTSGRRPGQVHRLNVAEDLYRQRLKTAKLPTVLEGGMVTRLPALLHKSPIEVLGQKKGTAFMDAREKLVESVERSGLLSPEHLQELRKRMFDPTWNITRSLETWQADKQAQGASHVGPYEISGQSGGVRFTITLDKKGNPTFTEETLRRMRDKHEKAGHVPSNTRTAVER